jgi:cation transport regulator ChaC
MKSGYVRHFLFGYGSLINVSSRARTNPSLAEQEGLPVLVRNIEREWVARTSSGYTAMGVKLRKNSKCTGVLFEVNKMELADLDQREKAYDRLEVQLNLIEQIPFLNEEDFYENERAEALFNSKENEENIRVWVYIQKNPIPADSSHPIPQSYVDVILSGCLNISEEFAKSFIKTTKGWENEREPSFVNDREIPIYVRANATETRKNGDTIDQLLTTEIPGIIEKRLDYVSHNYVRK